MSAPGRSPLARIRPALAAVLALSLLFAAPGFAEPTAPPPHSPAHIEVTSSVLASAGYDPQTQTLELTFHSGSTYRYLAVPSEIYEGLMKAESKGRFYNQFIRGRFKSEKVAGSKK